MKKNDPRQIHEETTQRGRDTCFQLAPYFGRGPTVIPPRSGYLAAVAPWSVSLTPHDNT